MKKDMNVPRYIQEITEQLAKAGYEAYIVGGCVRDLLMGKEPKDWDITTKARPEEVLKIFPSGKYENNFGTVLLPIKNKKDEIEDVVEITTYRSEQGYSDRRHPDEVKFEDDLEKDLARRDFTVNAMAIRLAEKQSEDIVDLFGGQKDLDKKLFEPWANQ